MTCLTDSPDVHVVSLPHLRPQLKVGAVHLVGRYATYSLVSSILAAYSGLTKWSTVAILVCPIPEIEN